LQIIKRLNSKELFFRY